jgi:hypothetical protein
MAAPSILSRPRSAFSCASRYIAEMNECFVRLERELLDRGLVEDAGWLHRTATGAYTTSSEMYGELGAIVQRIYRCIPEKAASDLRPAFEDCERLVRLAWPDFRIRREP